jgi:hypothetical protein
MSREMDRKVFLKRAGLSTVAAGSLPVLLGTEGAFGASPSSGQRAYEFVALSQAPATADGKLPRMFARGAGVFKPDAGFVHGGGTFFVFDQNTIGFPKQILAAGDWTPTEFRSYDTKGLQPYGTTQPSIVEMLADFEGLASGATLRVVCNVGAAGPPGQTGEEEGYELSGTPFGTFSQFMGLSYTGLEGSTVDRGA